MNTEDRSNFKEKISVQIEKTQEKIRQLEDMTKPISPENSIGRVSRMDAINNKSVAEAALRTARKRLSSLLIAHTKVDAPGFGICTHCQQPIPMPRLLFMPESTYCVKCAR